MKGVVTSLQSRCCRLLYRCLTSFSTNWLNVGILFHLLRFFSLALFLTGSPVLFIHSKGFLSCVAMRNYVQGQATLNLRFYQDKTAVLQQFSRIKIKSSPNACSPSISAFNCRVKRFFYFFAGFSGKETAGKIAFRIC